MFEIVIFADRAFHHTNSPMVLRQKETELIQTTVYVRPTISVADKFTQAADFAGRAIQPTLDAVALRMMRIFPHLPTAPCP